MTTEKIKTSEEVDKVTKKLEDTKEAVVTIYRKDSDKFEGQYKGSTGWFNLDHDYFKRKFSTLEPDLYKNFMKRILKTKTWNHRRRVPAQDVPFTLILWYVAKTMYLSYE